MKEAKRMKRARICDVRLFVHNPGFSVFTKHGHIAFSINEFGYRKVCHHFPHLKERILAANADVSFLVGRYCYYNNIVEETYDSAVWTRLI